MNQSPPTREFCEHLLEQRGWPISYPLILGLRDESIDPDDWGEWIVGMTKTDFLAVKGTTDPGRAPMERTGNIAVHPEGVARVSEGFAIDALYPGYHGKGGTNHDHPCWRQCDGQYGTERVPLMIERLKGGHWFHMTKAKVGPFNVHRALLRSLALRVGDFSHGCLVVRALLDHWRLCLMLGYPEHGPTPEQMATLRCSLYIISITPQKAA